MRKLTSVMLAVIIMVNLSLVAIAAEVDFEPRVNGDGRVVSKTIRTRRGSQTITGIYYADQSREVFRIMNEERSSRGLPKLTWEVELVQPAIVRALEQELAKSHTRPDGTDALTVSKLADGENLAGGDIEAADVMEGWMNSPSHESNILNAKYTSVAVACVETETMCYWVQLFHADAKAKPNSNSGANTTTTTSTEQSDKTDESDQSAERDGAVSAKNVIAMLEKAKSAGAKVGAKVKNAQSISPAALKEVAAWGVKNNRSVALTVDTTYEGKSTLQGRMVFNPAAFTGRTSDLKLGVFIDEAHTSDTAKTLAKWYKNKMAIVQIVQTGNLGGTAEIVVKTDLSELNTKSLMLYQYDKSNKKIVALENASPTVDKNGYLHFFTTKGGYIIITDKALVKK